MDVTPRPSLPFLRAACGDVCHRLLRASCFLQEGQQICVFFLSSITALIAAMVLAQTPHPYIPYYGPSVWTKVPFLESIQRSCVWQVLGMELCSSIFATDSATDRRKKHLLNQNYVKIRRSATLQCANSLLETLPAGTPTPPWKMTGLKIDVLRCAHCLSISNYFR